MKQCRKCGHFREYSEFAKHGARKDGLQGECRPCRKLITVGLKRGTPKNPLRQHELRRFWKYGITACEFTKMRISQNDKCAICKESQVAQIDHSHSTGLVRGLLCGPCNRGLGQFGDDPIRVSAAAAYLAAA